MKTNESQTQHLSTNPEPISKWTQEQYVGIVHNLKKQDINQIKQREEYVLFKEIVSLNFTEDSNSGNTIDSKNPVNTVIEGSGVNPPFCTANVAIDTSNNKRSFLAPLDIQKSDSIAKILPSFKALQSDRMSLNIGFDTEFQDCIDGQRNYRLYFSLQMSIAVGSYLIRYFFLLNPKFQEVSANGGLIPLKYCLADILDDLKKCYFPDFPLVLKRNIIYKKQKNKINASSKLIDFKAMKDSIIPITLICHTGKADLPVFRRSKYDMDLLRKLSEIQGGLMSTESITLKAENDSNYNYYWLINLCVRDTLGLTPAKSKSLADLGKLIGKPKIELPANTIEHMAHFAFYNTIDFYRYAMNDADIVVLFCSELFQKNHRIPITLSSAAALAMCCSIKDYFGVKSRAEYDRIYRGLELLDEGLIQDPNATLKFLKATRYISIQNNPDAKLISEYFEEAYTGGFNASFHIGWITESTIDLDLQGAYPTSMACVLDIDWSKNVSDFPRNHRLSLQDLKDPLTPAVAVGDFDFPETCYCPNIPVLASDGIKIYPRHGRHIYMTGPDMYLALLLGAKITIFRGFICQVLFKNEKPSQCLSHAVANLVQDRMTAKVKYKNNSLIEESLKTMVCSCYGKTAQNVSPKTKYSAKFMGRTDTEPSSVTSPYHAAYTTALVRCMLIACINQLHDAGYNVYSVTTDGFITNAPTDVVRSLDAYGFTQIFQNGRYILNQTSDLCEANLVWQPKHFNDTFLNITTRGNVAINDAGVLAHNSYTTGETKGSRADRDAYIIAVLAREGCLECSTKIWTQFSDLVERKNGIHVFETLRHLSMNFDYKRCPIIETAIDTPVHYDSANGLYHVDSIIAEYDTRPFNDVEEFLNYRTTLKNEKCVKTVADLERVKLKSTIKIKGYIGKDLHRKILLSILMGYRSGLYDIPALDGLKQSDIVSTVNSWNISKISINDWKNCSRSKRQNNMLPRALVDETLHLIQTFSRNVTTET